MTMNHNEEEDYSFEDPNDADLVMEELRIEMVRLQAQIDQLSASAQERAAEIAALRLRLTDLELRVDGLNALHRRRVRMWIWIAAMYGAAAGMGLSYLVKP
jgi:ABC-type phosphate transport system auxiliary subunit